MGGVFVNYRTDDGKWAADLIARELRSRFGAENVFLASYSIPPGEDFSEHIRAELRNSEVLLAVIGNRWLTALDAHGNRRLDNQDDWVRQEIAFALERPETRVVPIFIDGARPLTEDELPPDITALARREYRRLDHRYSERDLLDLVEKVAEMLPIPKCPYRGLEPFGEEDFETFCGRDEEAKKLTDLVGRQAMVVVAGSSGSGKSSLIHAGLLPRLRERGVEWRVFRPIPGRTPRELITTALSTIPQLEWVAQQVDADIISLADPISATLDGLVLCVDQFEELVVTDPVAATELFNLVSALTHAVPRRSRQQPTCASGFYHPVVG